MNAAADLQATDSGLLQLSGLDFLDTNEVRTLMAKHAGQPISMDLIRAIAADLLAYSQKHDRTTLAIEIPKQDISDGTLRLSVTPGTYSQLTVRGNRWFSKEQIERTLGIRPGEEILVSKLDEGVSWSNTNPFRQVRVALVPDAKDASRTEAVVTVDERIPFRVTLSYDNHGTKILGENQFDLSATYGNLWGQDHQVTYDFKTSDKPQVFQSHSALYRLPLPWRHVIQVQAAYASVHAFYNDDLFKTDAKNYITRANYCWDAKVPWGRIDLNVGLDYKQANSDLLFRSNVNNDLSQAATRTYDVAQFTGGGSTIIRDKHGAWLLGAGLNVSPGGLNSRNNGSTYSSLRPKASARYAYVTADLQRLLTLPYGMELVSQLHAQTGTSNLMGSEQMTIGGQGSARGYDERILSGDDGVTFSNELHSPAWTHVQRLPANKGVLVRGQVLGFLEFAKVRYHQKDSTDINLPSLASTGLGLRLNVANQFNLSMDYGWILRGIHRKVQQWVDNGDGTRTLKTLDTSLANGGRFTLKASLSY